MFSLKITDFMLLANNPEARKNLARTLRDVADQVELSNATVGISGWLSLDMHDNKSISIQTNLIIKDVP